MRRLGLLLMTVAVAGLALAAVVAQGASTKHLRPISIRDNAFWNYDFDKKEISATGVDWPVDLIFRNNADIDKIKAGLNGYLGHSGSKKYTAQGQRRGADVGRGRRQEIPALPGLWPNRLPHSPVR